MIEPQNLPLRFAELAMGASKDGSTVVKAKACTINTEEMKRMALVALKKPPPANVFNFKFDISWGTAGDTYALLLEKWKKDFFEIPLLRRLPNGSNL